MRICFVVADVKDQQPTYAGDLPGAGGAPARPRRAVRVGRESVLPRRQQRAGHDHARARTATTRRPRTTRARWRPTTPSTRRTPSAASTSCLLRYNPRPRERGRPEPRRSSTSAGACAWAARWWSTTPKDCAAPAAACTWPIPRRRARQDAGLALEEAAEGIPARARRPGRAEAAVPARRRERLLPAAAPGLEPEPDHHRRDQGRLRHRAGVPARDRAGRKAPAAAQRRAHPRRASASRSTAAARWSARTAARRPRTARTRSPCELGPVEARICDILRPKLLADGLYFVGVDIVGDKILELNVFTPGGIHSIHELYGIDVGDIVIRDLERRVHLRAAYRTTFDPEAADVV